MNLYDKIVNTSSTHSKIFKKVLLGVLFFPVCLITWQLSLENKAPILQTEIVSNEIQIEEDTPYPVHLSIPSIAVETHIQQVGLTPLGAMDVPSNIIDVGWFKHGPTPGAIGSSVISGHLNGLNNEPGVFAQLNTLKPGDMIFVTNSNDEILTFKIRELRDYEPGRADEVFTTNDAAHLNLITCEGEWNEKIKSYSKRRVVFSDLVL